MAYFINLKNGDTVTSPFLVQFGLKAAGVSPAGLQSVDTGHFHLLLLCLEAASLGCGNGCSCGRGAVAERQPDGYADHGGVVVAGTEGVERLAVATDECGRDGPAPK